MNLVTIILVTMILVTNFADFWFATILITFLASRDRFHAHLPA